MTERTCLNCGAPAAGTYDLRVRNTDHEEIPLCEECHEAIEQEIAESN